MPCWFCMKNTVWKYSDISIRFTPAYPHQAINKNTWRNLKTFENELAFPGRIIYLMQLSISYTLVPIGSAKKKYTALGHRYTHVKCCRIKRTVYPKKYAHSFCFAVLCCGYTLTDFPISIRLTSLALWQSNDCPSASKATLMNMDEYFMWIHYERLHNHNKAKHNKTVCIFLGIYCTMTSLQNTQSFRITQSSFF